MRLADRVWWQGPFTNRKISSLQLDIYLTLDNEPELSIRLGYIDLIDNEGELVNCFSINQVVEQNIFSKNQIETFGKTYVSAIILKLKVDSFPY